MEFKPKNRDWVKNAAIVFLSVLLVLTFFSNTIMNHNLPEVATQYVTSGSITAKVRGTGTVTAVGTQTVKATETREIRAVMVKVGQSVEVGDVLFVLGQGDATELQTAQEQLRQLQISYQRAAINITYNDYSLDELRIAEAQAAVEEARARRDSIQASSSPNLPTTQLAAANNEVADATARLETANQNLAAEQITYDTYKNAYDELVAAETARWDQINSQSAETLAARTAERDLAAGEVERLQTEFTNLSAIYQRQQTEGLQEGEEPVTNEQVRLKQQELEAAQAVLTQAEADLAAAQAAADQNQADGQAAIAAISDEQVRLQEAKVAEAQTAVDEATETLRIATEKRDAIQATIDEILGQTGISAELAEANAALRSAESTLLDLQYALQQKKAADARSQQLGYLDLTDLSQQIDIARRRVDELSGGEQNQIVAKVAGTVLTVECTPGDTVLRDKVLCTIEVPDMGYTLSFTVTNEQARRLKPGDTATVSNYYWGREVIATLTSIKTDPKNPQTNKLLTFDLSGDVTVGAELTLSVGQKSANYDTVVPNSAIRSDTSGSFVLVVQSKSSPLGNRYVARRVAVDVLAADDVSSAVTGDLNYGDYVITTSNAPVKNGELVRLADNA